MKKGECMKKIGLITISTLLIIGLVVFGINTKKDSNLEKVRVAEVTHSVFYAPFYIAVEEGYFEDEGIDLEIILAPGADKVTASVLSGDVEIGLCGSEATIYLYNQGLNDYLVNFSALTKRDGSFILGRNKNEVFDFKKLKGKTIIGGRKGGMPAMTLEWLLKEAGLKPGVDVFIDTSIAFTAMNGAFIGGQGDYVTLFNPSALKIDRKSVV